MLILDTSTECGFVAIVEGSELLYHIQLPFGMQNAQSVLAKIQQGLASIGLTIDKMDFVGVGVGPGSYTGIRVGATIAKTLSFACGLPLVGVCSLDGFVPHDDGAFAAVIDAKIGGVYLQTGFFTKDLVTELSGPQIHPINSAVRILGNIPVLVTPNAAQLRPKLEKEIGVSQWLWQESYPSPLNMAIRAKQKIDRQEFSLDGHLDLLYLRKTQAEIDKES
jgi:tRNA threonylcarbamoyl adenosine modification protein YeaZ